MIDGILPPPQKTKTKKTHGGPPIMLINSSALSNYVFGYTSVENALNNKMFYSISGIFFPTFTKGHLESCSFFPCGIEGRKSFWLLSFSLSSSWVFLLLIGKVLAISFQISNQGFHRIRPFWNSMYITNLRTTVHIIKYCCGTAPVILL